MIVGVFTGLAKFAINFALPGGGAILNFLTIAKHSMEAMAALYSAIDLVIESF
jgi:hypothetical protein